MLARLQTSRGFTLIELLVALSMSIIVLAALVSSLFSQQKVHMTQDRLIEMQQDLRSAVYLFGADVKMAGYDPTGAAGATFEIADQAEIKFQMDRNGDGDVTLKEFLGDEDDFNQLDENNDGFIEPKEAKSAESNGKSE